VDLLNSSIDWIMWTCGSKQSGYMKRGRRVNLLFIVHWLNEVSKRKSKAK